MFQKIKVKSFSATLFTFELVTLDLKQSAALVLFMKTKDHKKHQFLFKKISAEDDTKTIRQTWGGLQSY